VTALEGRAQPANAGEKITIDPFDDAVLQNPYPVYERLRRDAPVLWNEAIGTWWVSRYEDVFVGLLSDEFSAKTTASQLGITGEVDLGNFGRTNTLPTTDPPDHIRLRRIANRSFLPRAISDFRPRIETIANDLLSAAIGAGVVDIVGTVTETLPILVIAELLGVPTSEAATFKRSSLDMMKAFNGPRMSADEARRAETAVRDLEELFESLRIDRQHRPQSDILTTLAEAEADGAKLSRQEYLATCVLLLVAGNETTAGSLAAAVYLLGKNPVQYQALKEEPTLVDSATEEILRILGPVHWVVRRAKRDTDIAGCTVPAGQAVSFLLGSANRDETHFSNPDVFDVARAPSDHVAFGRGSHQCLGAPLARAEIQVFLGALLDNCGRIQLVDDHPRWTGSLQSRSLESVQVSLHKT
jgi:cytochrome P450